MSRDALKRGKRSVFMVLRIIFSDVELLFFMAHSLPLFDLYVFSYRDARGHNICATTFLVDGIGDQSPC